MISKKTAHRINKDPVILDGFSRTLPQIEWLLLVLILFYLITVDASSPTTLLIASGVYAVFVPLFQYVNFFKEPKEWKIVLHTWGMIFYISYVIWKTGEINSPLFNLYLLPIIASAITLSRVVTLLETGLIAASILYIHSTVSSDNFWTLATSSEFLMRFFPFLLVAYIITMLSSDIQKGFNRLKVTAETDELTNLFNRRALNQLAPKLFNYAIRHESTVSLIMIDVDNLKVVNDKYGHDAGNLLLINVSDSISSVLRGEDVAARYGGDEFIVILPDCDPDKAQIVARRIIENFEKAHFRYQGVDIELSASMGIAVCPEHGNSVETVIQCADKAMYASKKSGNNLITLFNQL
ncbi:MAG: GGDEF domain-containing protein [Gammaproteobacteria bacterium]|nr:GGDEF domain-containing protein [Gammaproteobacteria bacterium]